MDDKFRLSFFEAEVPESLSLTIPNIVLGFLPRP